MASLKPLKQGYCPGCRKLHEVGWPPQCVSQYNSLEDPLLRHFINNPVWFNQLMKAGLIDEHGRPITARTHGRIVREKERQDKETEKLVKEVVDRSLELETYREAMIRKKEEQQLKRMQVESMKNSRRPMGGMSVSYNGSAGSDGEDSVNTPHSQPQPDSLDSDSDSEFDSEDDAVGIPSAPSSALQGNDRRTPIEFQLTSENAKPALVVVHQHIIGCGQKLVYKSRKSLQFKDRFEVHCEPNNGGQIELIFYKDGQLSDIFTACCYKECNPDKTTRAPATMKNPGMPSFSIVQEPKDGRPCNKCQLKEAYGKPLDNFNG